MKRHLPPGATGLVPGVRIVAWTQTARRATPPGALPGIMPVQPLASACEVWGGRVPTSGR